MNVLDNSGGFLASMLLCLFAICRGVNGRVKVDKLLIDYMIWNGMK